MVCRKVRLITQGSLQDGHFALDLDCEDAPILPSNWSRSVSYTVCIINEQLEQTIQQGMKLGLNMSLCVLMFCIASCCSYMLASIM